MSMTEHAAAVYAAAHERRMAERRDELMARVEATIQQSLQMHGLQPHAVAVRLQESANDAPPAGAGEAR